MTDVLTRWGASLQLSREPSAAGGGGLEAAFRNGFLFGEVLYRHNQLDAFPAVFEDSERADALAANYGALQPALGRLGVPLRADTVLDLIRARRGVAQRVLYELMGVLARLGRLVVGRQRAAPLAAGAAASVLGGGGGVTASRQTVGSLARAPAAGGSPSQPQPSQPPQLPVSAAFGTGPPHLLAPPPPPPPALAQLFPKLPKRAYDIETSAVFARALRGALPDDKRAALEATIARTRGDGLERHDATIRDAEAAEAASRAAAAARGRAYALAAIAAGRRRAAAANERGALAWAAAHTTRLAEAGADARYAARVRAEHEAKAAEAREAAAADFAFGAAQFRAITAADGDGGGGKTDAAVTDEAASSDAAAAASAKAAREPARAAIAPPTQRLRRDEFFSAISARLGSAGAPDAEDFRTSQDAAAAIATRLRRRRGATAEAATVVARRRAATVEGGADAVDELAADGRRACLSGAVSAPAVPERSISSAVLAVMKEEGAFSERLAASAATAAVVARETTASELARNAALLATARGVLDVAVVDSLAAAHKAARGEAATRADAEATQARTLAARKAERADRIERERDLRRGRIATDVAVRGGVDSVDGRVHERPTSVDLPARVVMDLDLKLELEFVVSRGSVVGLSTAAAASWRRANGAEADSGVGPSSGHLPELTDISVGIVDDALDNASLMDLLQGVRQWEMPVGDAAVAGLPVAGSDLDELEGLLLSSALRATDSVGLRAVLPLCFADAAMLGADTARTAAASAVPAASSPAPLTPTSPVASSTVEPGAEISSGASARLPSLATAAISDRLGEQSSRRVLAAAIAAFSARDDADSAGDGTQVHGGTGRTAPVSADAVAPPATAQAKPAVEALRLLGDPLTQLALRLESAAARDMLGLMVAEVDAVVAAAAAPAEATRERDTLSAVSDDGPGSPRRVPSFQRTGVPSFGTTIAIVGPPHTGTAAVARVIAEALGLAVIHPASLAHRALALAGVDHRLPPKPAARVVANEPLLDTPSFDALLRRHGAALLSSIEAAGGTLASSWSAASEAPALVAALVVDAIRALAEASEPPVGWVLVDFPTSVAQARALEAAVTGFEAGGDDGSPTSRRESVASPLRAPLVDSSEVEDAVERILHGPTPALPQLSPLVVDGVDDDVERGGDASALASVGHSSSSSPTAHSRGPAAKSPSPLELSRLVAPAPLPSGRDAAASYFAVMWPTAIRSVVCLRAGLPGIVRRALGWQLDTSSVTSNTAPLEEVLHSPGAAAAALELASENEPTQSASLDAHRGGGHDAGASSSGRASTTAEGGGDAVLAVLEGAASRGMRIDGNAGAALAVSIAAGGAAGLLASSRDCPSASALSARGVTALPWPPVASTDTLSLSAVAAPAVYHLDTSPPARTFLAADACSLLLAGDAGHRPGALDGEGVAPAAVGVVETRDDRVLAISSAFREWTTVNEPALERWFSRGRTWSFVDAAVPSMMGQSGAVEGEGEGGSRITRPGALHADRHSTLLLPEIAKDALRVVRARLRALEESEAAREAALRVCEAASLHDAAEQSARLEAARRRRSGHGIAAARAVLRVLAASIAETLSVGAPSVAPPASPAAMSAAPSVRAAPAALLAAVDTSFASVAVASAAEAVARHARLGLATARLVPPPLPPAAAATPSSPLASVVRFSVVQAGGTPLASAATSSGDDSTPPATSAVGGGASRAAIAAVLSTAWHSAVAASLVESRAGVRQLREIDRRVATVLAGLRDRQEQAAGGSAAFDLPSIVDVGSGSGAGNGAEGLAAPTPLSTPGARADAAVGALAQAAREGHVEALWDTVESRERLALARVEAARIAAWQEALIREVDSAHATLVRAETRRFKAALSMLYDYAAAAEGVPLGASYGRSAVFPGAAAAEPSLVSDAVALPAPSSKGAVASKQVGGDKVGGAVKGSTAAAASASVAKGAKGAGGTHSAANAPLSVDEPHLAPIDGPSLLRAGDGALVQRMLSVILEPPEGDGSEPRADSAVVVVAAVVDAPSASSAPPPRGGSAGAKLSAPVAAKAVPAVPAPTSALSVKGAGASKAAAPAVRDAGSHALADPTPAALSALDALLALTPDASSALPALPEAHGRLQSLTAPLASVLRAVQRGLSAAFLVVAQAEALAVGQARARAVLMERERALLSSVLARQSEESAAAAAAAAEAAAGPPFVPAASVKKGSAAKPASASASATKVNNAAIIAEATSPPSFSAESSSSLPSSPASAIASVLPILDADAAAAPPPVDEGLFVAMRYEAGAYAERLVRLARHAVVAAARVRAAAAFAERDVLAAAARAALADGAAVERVSAIADSALEADDANARLVSGVGVREVGLGVGAACAS